MSLQDHSPAPCPDQNHSRRDTRGPCSAVLASVDLYSPTLKAWQAGPALTISERRGLGLAVLGSRLFAIGGDDGNPGGSDGGATTAPGVGRPHWLSSIEIYDPAVPEKGWTSPPAPSAMMGVPRVGFGLATLGSRLWIIGGANVATGAVLNSTAYFDEFDESWYPGPPLAVSRRATAAVALFGRLYSIGGVSPSEHLVREVELCKRTRYSNSRQLGLGWGRHSNSRQLGLGWGRHSPAVAGRSSQSARSAEGGEELVSVPLQRLTAREDRSEIPSLVDLLLSA